MSEAGVRRLTKELKKVQASPIPNVIIKPLDGNFFRWVFLLHNLPHPDYRDGLYLGRLEFPANYPNSPPDVVFISQTGRFETDKKVCLSFTSYHPETWTPGWTIETMMLGLISYMLSEEHATGTIRGVWSSERVRLAKASRTKLLLLTKMSKAHQTTRSPLIHIYFSRSMFSSC